MCDSDDNWLVRSGTWGSIRYAVRDNGKALAKEFIDTLDDSQKRKLAVLFQRMADIGTIRNREQFRKVSGAIFEFKRHQLRIGCFQVERTWFLTHGFSKKTDDWLPSELQRANDIRSEHLARRGSRP
jgi:hypothetical protein